MTRTGTTAAAAFGEDDVGGISEITILPDGRLYVLGLSRAVWDMLEGAGPWGGLSPDRQACRPQEREAATEANSE